MEDLGKAGENAESGQWEDNETGSQPTFTMSSKQGTSLSLGGTPRRGTRLSSMALITDS